MPTALTGSPGWTGLHPMQLGGPPLISTFDRLLPPTTPPFSLEASAARPFIGHAYGNDGVTAVATFSLLNRPVLNPTLANGGFNQLLLEVAAPVTGLTQGNVVRLSEQGGDGSFVYGGTVEDLPDTIGPGGVSHQILVSPFAVELDDTFSQAVYTIPTDISQLVRDAVALTRHCSCDQTSVPASTGILAATVGVLDFRNQPVKQVIDTARSIAGPTWFWHVDETGRVWFQAMSSTAVYTIPRAQYESRTKSTSIQDRKNKVVVIGGVPTGTSTPVTATADDATNQTAIGIRALNPPLQVPHIADSAVVSTIATNILTVLNRNWQRVDLKVLSTFGRRIHASQPGGAMLRYWEPVASPMQESATGISGYTGPFIAQTVSNDGLYQQVVAGDIPVTSQNDVQNMVNSMAARTAAISLQLPGPTLSGYTVLQSTNATYGGGRISVVDGNQTIRADFGNLPANGISPAQFGFRANDVNGVPIFDSQQGLIQPVMVNITDNVGGTIAGNPSGIYTVKSQSFTLARPATVMGVGLLNGYVSDTGGILALAANAFIQVDGSTASGKGEVPIFINSGAGNPVSVSPTQVLALAAGTYTAKLLWDTLTTITQTLHWQSASLLVVRISG